MKASRHILHIDMDAFFASVEQMDHPHLKGKPIVVGGRSKRSVVSAASYEARKYGIHSAMPMSTALRQCNTLIVMPHRMQRYSELSREIHRIFKDYTPLIEPLSVDEAFLDVTGSTGLFGDAETIGHTIKDRIKNETGLTASVGIAPNKFLAKLASDLDKPDGFVKITHENMQSILDPLAVNKIWGIGKQSFAHLKQFHIRTIKDLRVTPIEQLVKIVGNSAESLHRLAQGIDNRPVQTLSQRKSISSEHTFSDDESDQEHLKQLLLDQVQEVACRLRAYHFKAKTIQLKFRSGNFETFTRSATLETPTASTDILWDHAKTLFEIWRKSRPFALRLLGFGVSQFIDMTHGQQLTLFEDEQEKKLETLDSVVDDINRRFGKNKVKRSMI